MKKYCSAIVRKNRIRRYLRLLPAGLRKTNEAMEEKRRREIW